MIKAFVSFLGTIGILTALFLGFSHRVAGQAPGFEAFTDVRLLLPVFGVLLIGAAGFGLALVGRQSDGATVDRPRSFGRPSKLMVVAPFFVLTTGCLFSGNCIPSYQPTPGQSGKVVQYDPTTDTWADTTSLPAAVSSLGFATAPNGDLYVAGGYVETLPTSSVYSFNIYSATWTSRKSMPTARAGFGLATAANGKLYAVGGFVYTNTVPFTRPSNVVEEYDPAADTWTPRAPMPTTRANFGFAAADNGMLYAVGGVDAAGAVLPTVEAYDPGSNSWTTKTPMPAGRTEIGLASYNGKLYAAGGWDGNAQDLQIMDVYDPGTNAWAPLTSMATKRKALGLIASGGKLYALGGAGRLTGFAGILQSGVVEQYDPALNSWLTTKRGMVPRDSFGLTLANGRIYVAGGNLSDIYNEHKEALAGIRDHSGFNPAIAADIASVELRDGTHVFIGGADTSDCARNEIWTQSPPVAGTAGDFTNPGLWTKAGTLKTESRGAKAAVLPSGGILVAGGATGCGPGTPLATVEGLTVQPDGSIISQNVTPMGAARVQHLMTAFPAGSATHAGDVLVAGGVNFSGTLSSAEIYVFGIHTWVPAASMKSPRRFAEGVWLPNGKLLVAGGATDVVTKTAELYDPATNSWAYTGSMLSPRAHFTLQLLGDGTVMAAGGTTNPALPSATLSSTETYNPATGLWTASGNLNTARMFASMTVVTGTQAAAQLILNARSNISATELLGAEAGAARLPAAAVPTTTVFVLGGKGLDDKPVGTVEVFDPTTGKWVQLPAIMDTPRYNPIVFLDGVRLSILFGQTAITGSQVLTAEEYIAADIGIAGQRQAFTGFLIPYTGNVISAMPVSLTVPITYVWQATDQSVITHTSGITDAVSYVWPAAGTKAITMTAFNALGSMQTVMTVTVSTTASKPPNQNVFVPAGVTKYQAGW